MKKVIRASDDDMFVPVSFAEDKSSVDSILTKLKRAVIDKYGRRFKQISVELKDTSFTDSKVSSEVVLYNNNVLKADKVFNFTAYEDYWDEADYQQHINISINKFVEDLL